MPRWWRSHAQGPALSAGTCWRHPGMGALDGVWCPVSGTGCPTGAHRTSVGIAVSRRPGADPAGPRNFFSYACSGQRQFSTVSFSGFGLWVRVRVLGSDNHNSVPNSNPNLNHNSNRNLTLTPILTPNSS